MAASSGKVILHGEHAVVYGVPAIAAGLEKGATARATPTTSASIRLGDREVVQAGHGEVGAALSALLSSLGAPACAVEVTLDIPAGVGLGASAAIAVAAARAVSDAFQLGANLDRIVDAAMAWERVFHGNPSGVDAWAAAHAGCFIFTRGTGIKPIDVATPLPLAVAVAGPPASTRAMVEGVAKLREKKPEMVQKSFEGIRSLSQNAALCIEAGDLRGLGKLFDLNQMLLSGLFLSTEQIETACGIARDAGALGAKLTGSGGGGCVIALAEGDPEPILMAWRRANLQCFSSVVRGYDAGGPP